MGPQQNFKKYDLVNEEMKQFQIQFYMWKNRNF